MTLSAKVISAVNKAKAKLSDAVTTATLVKNQSDINPLTAKTVGFESRTPIEIAITKYQFHQIDGESIRESDMSGVIFTRDANVSEGCFIESDGVRYKVIKTSEVRIGSEIIVLEVQLRR